MSEHKVVYRRTTRGEWVASVEGVRRWRVESFGEALLAALVAP